MPFAFDTEMSFLSFMLLWLAGAGKKAPLNTYTPAKILPCPFTRSLAKQACERAASGTLSSSKEIFSECCVMFQNGTNWENCWGRHLLVAVFSRVSWNAPNILKHPLKWASLNRENKTLLGDSLKHNNDRNGQSYLNWQWIDITLPLCSHLY